MKKYEIGVLGGGQLGKMLADVTDKWGISTCVLDPSAQAPCRHLPGFEVGDFKDFNTVYRFGKQCEILTVEIEHVNIDALKKLESEGVRVYPQPAVLEIVQDKIKQKRFYRNKNIPTVDFEVFEDLKSLRRSSPEYPFVWKAARMGYDGKGVRVVRDEAGLNALPDIPCVVEKFISIQKEFSVIVSRHAGGKIAVYEPVEMQFNDQANLVEFVLAPTCADEEFKSKLVQIAVSTVSAYSLTGIMAVELIYSEDDELYVNEVAPRPHNSGHYSIEACMTSQFEQHIKAISGLPPGATDQLIPAVMYNLTGEEFYLGAPLYPGKEEVLEISGAKLHLYGKSMTRAFRKMGHVTVLAPTRSEAYDKALKIKNTIRVIGEDQISCD